MVARKPGHQGERGISRKPLRREGRTVSVNLWRLRSCAFLLRARLRVQPAPGFPCALYFLGRMILERLGRNPRCGSAKLYPKKTDGRDRRAEATPSFGRLWTARR